LSADLEYMLMQWASWAKTGNVKLFYSSHACFAIIKSKTSFFISEEQALQLDRIIAGLERSLTDFVFNYYIRGLSIRKIARGLHIDEKKVIIIKSCALCEIEKGLGYLK